MKEYEKPTASVIELEVEEDILAFDGTTSVIPAPNVPGWN